MYPNILEDKELFFLSVCASLEFIVERTNANSDGGIVPSPGSQCLLCPTFFIIAVLTYISN